MRDIVVVQTRAVRSGFFWDFQAYEDMPRLEGALASHGYELAPPFLALAYERIGRTRMWCHLNSSSATNQPKIFTPQRYHPSITEALLGLVEGDPEFVTAENVSNHTKFQNVPLDLIVDTTKTETPSKYQPFLDELGKRYNVTLLSL